MSKIIIAIDGYAGCGKSTLAQSIAQTIDYLYLDTGAMYRAMTWFFLKNNISVDQLAEIISKLNLIKIDFKKVGEHVHTFLNDEDVESHIRSMEVTSVVTKYSAIKEVRQYLVSQQQEIGQQKGIVIDGRDIGTVVFPNAELKFFITANIEIRAQRRFQEFKQKQANITMAEVIENLKLRDEDETTRKESPLIKAEDAIEIDTSSLDKEEVLQLALNYYFSKNQSED